MVAKPLCPLYKNIIKPLDRARYPELRYIYKLVIKVLLPKKCVPEKMSEQELYKIIRKRHCRNIALLKLYTFNKVYSLCNYSAPLWA